MGGKFVLKKFVEIDANDNFFDSLKTDYPEFPIWFQKKSEIGEKAFVFSDGQGIGAFIYLKKEAEPIKIRNKELPSIQRLKIGTLKLHERIKGIRMGEGAIGIALWYWQEMKCDEVYITVFDKHKNLIDLILKFGFICEGFNERGESVYLKNRKNIDYSNPYKSFPFINSNFVKAGIIPIYDKFHDRLFPYSELKNNKQEIYEETAGNGISKVYIGTPFTAMHYNVDEPVLIYRIYTGIGQKTYKSVVTSFAVITKIQIIKNNGSVEMSLDDFFKEAGNKSVFTKDELTTMYAKNKNNLVMLELLYNGFFGKGKNVIHKTLNDKGMFNSYPYSIEYSKEQFTRILEMGAKDVSNIIIN